MALRSRFVCTVCNNEVTEAHPASQYPTVCHECTERQEQAALQAFLIERKRLTVEERLALIEEWIYITTKHNQQQRHIRDMVFG